LGITQILDPAYAIAIAIATAFQATLQATITHHGTMPNNLNPIPTLINLYPKKPINATANIPPTIDALVFVNLVGEFFRVFELEFLVKSFEKNLQLATFFQQKDETFKMFYRRFLKLKKDTQSIIDLKAVHQYLRSLEGIPTLHAQVLQRVFIEFKDSYTFWMCTTFLKSWNLLMHTMRPPSHSRPQSPPVAPSRSSHYSSRPKAVESTAFILTSCKLLW